MSAPAVPVIPERIRSALEQVLNYTMPDEAEDYGNTPPEERDGHIYEALLAVGRWLDTGVDVPPTRYVSEIYDLDDLFLPRGE